MESPEIKVLRQSMGDLLTALYCEKRNLPQVAAKIYFQKGYFHKALDLAFHHLLFDEICEFISQNRKTEPELFKAAENLLLEHNHFGRAVELNISLEKYVEALEICNRYGVLVPKGLEEKLQTVLVEDNNKDETDEEVDVV